MARSSLHFTANLEKVSTEQGLVNARPGPSFYQSLSMAPRTERSWLNFYIRYPASNIQGASGTEDTKSAGYCDKMSVTYPPLF